MTLEMPQVTLMLHVAFKRLVIAIFLPLSLGGCLATTPIKIEDKRVFLPALRAGLNLDDGKQYASELRSGHAIEFGLMKANGGGNQSLSTGQEPIVLNYTTFTGPQQLRNDFNFSFADISWRWREFLLDSPLGIELLAGAGFSSLRLEVSSATQRASGSFSEVGAQGGLGVFWRFDPVNSIQARMAVFSALDTPNTLYDYARLELSYTRILGENLTLRAGYASWDVKGSQGGDMSNYQLRFSGPTLVLDWDFNTN